ncbi:MAG: bifunctional lysylphosphatidylglycerol flippase/synthetase MprF [Bilifractor sp.]
MTIEKDKLNKEAYTIVAAATATEQEWDRALSCLRKYAENSLAYLSLEPDKQWLLSDSPEGLVSFARSGHTIVVCGDPICADADFEAILQVLRSFAASERCHLVFLMTEENHIPEYKAEGFGCFKSGEEATFDVPNWSMQGGKCAKARSSWHTAVHYGLSVKEYCPQQKRDEQIERQFHEITDAWLGEKHTARLQFAVGSLMLEKPCDKRYFYAVDPDGVIQGINVLNPYLGGKGWIVDIMRRREGCPHGVMEILFHDIMETLKKEGAEQASLGVAPFFNTEEDNHPLLIEKAEHYIYENMNYIYGFKPLYNAKEKFNPIWKSVYVVCYPKHMSLWMEEAAFAVLDSQGFSDYVHAYLEMRRAQKEAKREEQ